MRQYHPLLEHGTFQDTKENHVTNYILSIEKLGHILSDPIFVSNLKVNYMPSRISFNLSMA